MKKPEDGPVDNAEFKAELNNLRQKLSESVDSEAMRDMKNNAVLYHLRDVLEELRSAKPGDRTAEDRAYAVVITDMEKVIAYFDVYIAP